MDRKSANNTQRIKVHYKSDIAFQTSDEYIPPAQKHTATQVCKSAVPGCRKRRPCKLLLQTNFRTPDMVPRKPVRFLVLLGTLRSRNGSRVEFLETACGFDSGPGRESREL